MPKNVANNGENLYDCGNEKKYPLPYWVYESVIYEIFPDRFAIGIEISKKEKFYRGAFLRNWGDLPEAASVKEQKQNNVFFGGDLVGILDKIKYLTNLGVNALYLTPIFRSPSNHKYDTTDYFKIDPQLGGMRAFKKLLSKLKSHNIRLILDGVFNHISTEHIWFKRAINGNKDYKSRFSFYNDGHRGWWGIQSLPELNLEEVSVRSYLADIIVHYLNLGIDGWRLDCGQDLGLVNNSYIASVIKSVSINKYVVSELWTYPERWNMVDGIMNYHFREIVLSYLNSQLTDIGLKLEKMYEKSSNIYGSWNMLDSHDTERLASTFPDKSLRKIAILLQFTFPGVPVIYYGTEVGMEGGKDPDCRRTMIWDESKWDMEILEFYRWLIKLRKTETALKVGTFELLNNEPLVFLRKGVYPLNNIVVAINKGKKTSIAVPITDGRILDRTIFNDLLSGERFKITSGMLELSIPERGFRVLKPANEIVKGYNQYKRIY